MTLNNTATNLIADHEARNVGKDSLGKIAWFSVTALTVDHAFLKAKLDSLGLGTYCPPRPADSDVFRRVTKASERNRIQNDDETYCNVMVRDVNSDTDSILRRIVVETVDQAGARLDYTEAYDLTFDKDTGRLSTHRLTVNDSVADDIIPDVRAAYLAERGQVNADGVRSMVTRALKNSHAITVRPTGGVMFVPRDYVSVLDALQQVGDAVPEASIHSLTLLDEPGQPEMLAEALTSKTVNQADQMATEMAKLIRAGTISERRLTTMIGEYKGLRRRLSAYQDLLGDDLGSVKVRLAQLDAQMGQAALQVEAR